MVFALSWDNGLNSMRIILAGVAVNAIFVGATSLLSILNSDKIQGILLWINGSIAYKGWTEVKYLVPYSIIGIILSLLCAKGDRKSTRLNSSHANISYAVFCLKKKKHIITPLLPTRHIW